VEVSAAGSISASAERIFVFVQTLEHQFELIGGRAERLAAASTSARVRLRGPLGVCRTVSASLTYARSPESIVGRVEAGRSSRGTVRWSVQRSGVGSWVQVIAHADALGPVDAMLLWLGGRRWLARSLELALERLEEQMRRTPRQMTVDTPSRGPDHEQSAENG
jgi:hypothetical protein